MHKLCYNYAYPRLAGQGIISTLYFVNNRSWKIQFQERKLGSTDTSKLLGKRAKCFAHYKIFFSYRDSFALNVVFFEGRRWVVHFILFYFAFRPYVNFWKRKKYINKRSDSQLLVEAFNKKKLNLKTLLDVSMYVLIRAKLFY